MGSNFRILLFILSNWPSSDVDLGKVNFPMCWELSSTPSSIPELCILCMGSLYSLPLVDKSEQKKKIVFLFFFSFSSLRGEMLVFRDSLANFPFFFSFFFLFSFSVFLHGSGGLSFAGAGCFSCDHQRYGVTIDPVATKWCPTNHLQLTSFF